MLGITVDLLLAVLAHRFPRSYGEKAVCLHTVLTHHHQLSHFCSVAQRCLPSTVSHHREDPTTSPSRPMDSSTGYTWMWPTHVPSWGPIEPTWQMRQLKPNSTFRMFSSATVNTCDTCRKTLELASLHVPTQVHGATWISSSQLIYVYFCLANWRPLDVYNVRIMNLLVYMITNSTTYLSSLAVHYNLFLQCTFFT